VTAPPEQQATPVPFSDGSLRVLRIGAGGAAVRVPGSALTDYVRACEQAAGRVQA
jgi:hypothetical protein